MKKGLGYMILGAAMAGIGIAMKGLIEDGVMEYLMDNCEDDCDCDDEDCDFDCPCGCCGCDADDVSESDENKAEPVDTLKEELDKCEKAAHASNVSEEAAEAEFEEKGVELGTPVSVEDEE